MSNRYIYLILIILISFIFIINNCTAAGAEMALIIKWYGDGIVYDSSGFKHYYKITYEFMEDDTGKYLCEEKIFDKNLELISDKYIEKSDMKITYANSIDKIISLKYVDMKISRNYKYRIEATGSVLTLEDYVLPDKSKKDTVFIHSHE